MKLLKKFRFCPENAKFALEIPLWRVYNMTQIFDMHRPRVQSQTRGSELYGAFGDGKIVDKPAGLC